MQKFNFALFAVHNGVSHDPEFFQRGFLNWLCPTMNVLLEQFELQLTALLEYLSFCSVECAVRTYYK